MTAIPVVVFITLASCLLVEVHKAASRNKLFFLKLRDIPLPMSAPLPKMAETESASPSRNRKCVNLRGPKGSFASRFRRFPAAALAGLAVGGVEAELVCGGGGVSGGCSKAFGAMVRPQRLPGSPTSRATPTPSIFPFLLSPPIQRERAAPRPPHPTPARGWTPSPSRC